MTTFQIGSYKIESETVYNYLINGNITSDEELKLLDKDGDMVVSEDEFVDATELIEDDETTDSTDDTTDTSSSSSSSSTSLSSDTESEIFALQQELDQLMEERRQLYNELSTAADIEEMNSISSEIDGLDSEINSVRDDIYAAYKDLETSSSSSSSTSSTSSDSSTESTGTYTYSGDDEEFVEAFNNSSFSKGILAGEGEMVAAIAEEYGIDPNLLSAIMALETGWGTSNAIKNYNNPGGMMSSGSLIQYSSLEEGIRAVAKNLKNNYIDKGLTTISSIGAKYCPGSSGWISSVTTIYNTLTGASITSTTSIA